MKNLKINITILSFLFVLSSCGPRIDLDLSQWGDNSELVSVVLFVYEFEDHELEEFITSGQLTPGVRRVIRSTNLVINLETKTASVDLPAAYSLADDVVVMAVEHTGTLVEPLNNAPVLGLPADLTTGPYDYRINSADGNFTDWEIAVNQL